VAKKEEAIKAIINLGLILAIVIIPQISASKLIVGGAAIFPIHTKNHSRAR
jgi:hypothetical protein